ncbi:glycoside hydrolase 5 family protein [Trueperella pecoris]|uniref:Glycosyl hydrolase n=1 Tax=Trueperella pecoris TaxID=2733571 RepID=A0A7M1QVA4_9ACTO|nr:hypothetical protein [Trueperella pecoris]QOQ38074.1 hypothetical protein HLG82_00510 [Trueperella pecoris]QOR45434.1 hypothetical protein INS88_09275 [Trueperella pecoris]QTG75318.1 hypothetical protein J4179_08925 [Trueperella pecoris]
MKFGVNYTPRAGWFHSWLDFDPAAIASDLDAIASLGVDHLRIFPLWPLLQPNRSLIREAGLDDVVTVVELAAERGMNTYVDVLQGHLSSFDFLPAWVSTWHRRNLFTDADVVSGERALVHAMATRLRDVRGARGLSLGNEFIQFAADRHPDQHRASIDQIDAWLEDLLGTARTVWPEGTHVHTHDEDLWFDNTHPFTPAAAVNAGDLTTVHSWVFGRVGPRLGAGAPELEWYSRYLCELAAGWSADPDRGVWLQEIGSPSNYVDPADAAGFLTANIDRLLGAEGGGTAPNLQAITWWCSHDVSRNLVDFPEVEYTLGLFDSDGDIKPIGSAYKEAIERYSDAEPTRIERPTMAITLTPDGRDLADASHEFFDSWMASTLNGDVPRIVVNN